MQAALRSSRRASSFGLLGQPGQRFAIDLGLLFGFERPSRWLGSLKHLEL